jgi:hypothetical protein
MLLPAPSQRIRPTRRPIPGSLRSRTSPTPLSRTQRPLSQPLPRLPPHPLPRSTSPPAAIRLLNFLSANSPTLKATSSGSRLADAQTPLRMPLSNGVWSYVRSAAKEFESLLARPRRTIASSPPTPMSLDNWPIQLRKPSSTFTMLVPSGSAP